MRCVLAVTVLAGCADLRRENSTAPIPPPAKRPAPSLAECFFKANYFYPVRDYLTLSWAGRALFGDEAWDVLPGGGVPDSGLYVNRDLSLLPPDAFANGANYGRAPDGPWRVVQPKSTGQTIGFIGEDASGRRWMVKLDAPEYPELGTAAEAIAARIYWSMGYQVPGTFVVGINGTGDARYDGRRAVASEMVPGDVLGPFRMDHFRMRREMRAMRLVLAWVNDPDRGDRNTVAANQNGTATFYFVDFNSALGSWNGRPKQPWRGHRYVWDIEWQWIELVSLGLAHPDVNEAQPIVSPAVGRFWSRFEPKYWRPQNPCAAFDRMTPADAAWMAGKMSALSDAQLKSIVAAGRFSRAEDASYVFETLRERRVRIIAWVHSLQAGRR